MLSGLNTPESLAYAEISLHNLHSGSAAQENFLDKSEIHPSHLICSERFAELNSFSLRNFAFFCESDHPSVGLERTEEQAFLEDPLYNVLSLRRGKSECFIDEEERFSQAQQYFIQEPTALIDIDFAEEREDRLKYFCSNTDLHLLPDHEDSEGDSKNMLSTSNQALTLQKEASSIQSKVSTKNVTKNMGKLLFKYIWKNRISLRKFFSIQNEAWDSFISDIRVWKKENNITREFLNIRWHSQDKNSKLFRVISHHFFRRRCLSAIFLSKIECKQMHIRRLRRFQEATSNPSALDNLN